MKYGYARVSTDDQSTALQFAALKRAGCKTLFKDEGLSGATTKRPACAEADGLSHYIGYRLGLYLAYGFLRRRATVGLLQHKCERVHARAGCPSRCSSVHICTAKCSVYRMPENLREPIGVQWQMMCCPDARERIRIYGGTFGGITNA